MAGQGGEDAGSGPWEGHGGGRGKVPRRWPRGGGGDGDGDGDPPEHLGGGERFPNRVLTRSCSLPQPTLLRTPALRSTATFAQALQFVPETQVSLLDNGLRVASEQSSQPTCTVSWGRHWGEGLQIRPAIFSQVGV